VLGYAGDIKGLRQTGGNIEKALKGDRKMTKDEIMKKI